MTIITRFLLGALLGFVYIATASNSLKEGILPSYHYGAPIAVECMNRSV